MLQRQLPQRQWLPGVLARDELTPDPKFQGIAGPLGPQGSWQGMN